MMHESLSVYVVPGKLSGIRKLGAAIAVLLLAASGSARAFDCPTRYEWLETKCAHYKEAVDHGDDDLYLPIEAHHGRGTYTADKIKTYNEQPRGLGYGRSVTDGKGDWHGYFAMAFSDSHFKPEYMIGYAYQTYWGNPGSLEAGLGYTLFVTTRSDYDHYLLPVPGITPLASLRYKRLSLMASYVPRLSVHKGNGDVLFIFARIGF